MNHRAYSTFEVKSVDAEQRIITGIASTPESDRGGDKMASQGARFKLPMPFRFKHATDIGEVFAADVTPAGIVIHAKVLSIAETGRLKDEIDYAWQSIKNGLAKGLSIGWSPLKTKANKDGGLDVSEWHWLETSAVPIPMNEGATILAIKAIDGPLLAASGEGHGPVVRPYAGVAAHVVKASKGAGSMKTTTEQISVFQATRQAKAAERSEIMQKSAEAGTTLEPDQKEKYDGLTVELKELDEHLVRLGDYEAEQKAAAIVVTGETPHEASRSRGGIVQVKSNMPPEMAFVRYVICKAVAYLSQGSQSAMEVAKDRYADHPEIQLMLKAAVAGATTLDANYAAQLAYATDAPAAFLNWLRPQTILGKIDGMTNVPFNVRYGTQTSGGSANWVGQGKPKPLTSFTFSSGTLGITKLAAIAVLADELVRVSSPNAEALVRQSLAEAIIQQLDLDFIDPANAGTSNVKPASITNGVSALTSAGTSSDNAITDLAKLLKPIVEAKLDPTKVVFIMPATLSMSIGLMTNSLGQLVFPDMGVDGGRMRGIRVVASQQAAFTTNYGNVVIAVHAPSIYLADDGQVSIDVSREASLEMLDSSLVQDGAAGTGASLVSMFQTNMLAIRAERYINWKKARTAAVQWMSDVNWGSIGSPA